MKMFIIYEFTGDCAGMGNRPEKMSGLADCRVKTETFCPVVPGKPVAQSVPLWRGWAEKNARLEEENRLMKEELNELYLKYDRMCAAFGEMNHLVAETAAVATRFAREEEEE